MQKVVNISNDKKNVLEFDIEVSGADDNNMSVRFIIESEEMELGFDSKKGKGATWSVEIPPMKILKNSIYPFHISVVVDGYAFEGLSGEVNIIGERGVTISNPENIILSPAKHKPIKKVAKTEPKEKATIVKPKHKTLLKPAKLKMVDSETLKKELTKKKPATTPKTPELLDNVVELISKAGAEKKASEAEKVDVKTAPKKTATKKKVKKVTKKVEDKKVKEDIFQQADKINSGGPIYPIVKDVAKDVLVEADKKPIEKQKENKGGFSAKNIAQGLIKAVTGIGEKNEDDITEQHDKAVKDILNEKVAVKKDTPVKKRASRKKVIMGKEVVEVNSDKEDRIKDILKEDDTRSITTKPDKTIH